MQDQGHHVTADRQVLGGEHRHLLAGVVSEQDGACSLQPMCKLCMSCTPAACLTAGAYHWYGTPLHMLPRRHDVSRTLPEVSKPHSRLSPAIFAQIATKLLTLGV
jgi:hypothetical protein